MLSSIISGILALFFTALVLGVAWIWVGKPCLGLCKDFYYSLKGTFLIGTSVGYKLIPNPKERVMGEKGELTEGAAFIEKFAVPDYEIADWVKSVPVANIGYVLFRGYRNHLERNLVIDGNPSLQRKLGKRVHLPVLKGRFNLDNLQYVDITVDEVIKLAEANVSMLESKPVTTEPVEVKEPKISSPAKTPVNEVKKAKPLETIKGYLINYGKAVRHLSSKDENGVNVGKEIEQFRVVVKGEDGVEESIWGQDLLRAIKDANINLNDMVEVIKTGKRPNGNSFKNLYAINKVA